MAHLFYNLTLEPSLFITTIFVEQWLEHFTKVIVFNLIYRKFQFHYHIYKALKCQHNQLLLDTTRLVDVGAQQRLWPYLYNSLVYFLLKPTQTFFWQFMALFWNEKWLKFEYCFALKLSINSQTFHLIWSSGMNSNVINRNEYVQKSKLRRRRQQQQSQHGNWKRNRNRNEISVEIDKRKQFATTAGNHSRVHNNPVAQMSIDHTKQNTGYPHDSDLSCLSLNKPS